MRETRSAASVKIALWILPLTRTQLFVYLEFAAWNSQPVIAISFVF